MAHSPIQMCFTLFTALFLSSTCWISNAHTIESIAMQTALPTVTVRGFLNFRTTVDGTVIVFTPTSAALQPSSVQVTPMQTQPPSMTFAPLSVQETPSLSSVANPSSSANDSPQAAPGYPTGLVTVIASTVINNGLPTALETRVFGTYLNGKYAQILKSSSRILQPSQPTAAIQPTSIMWTPQAKHVTTPSPQQRSPFKSAETSKPSEPEEKSEERNPVLLKRGRLARMGSNRFAPRSQSKIRLNRFKSKPQQTTQKIKEEEEAAKQINQRFHKRLGVNRGHTPKQEPVNHEQAESTRRQLTVEPGTQVDLESLVDLNDKPVESAQSSTSNIVDGIKSKDFGLLNNALLADPEQSNGLNAPVDSAPPVADPLLLPTTTHRFNELTGEDEVFDQQAGATPPLIITRTYSLSESSTRTSVVPMLVAGQGVINQTITEAFVMHKLITAYRTLPPGDLLLLNTEDPSIAPSMIEHYTLANLTSYWKPFETNDSSKPAPSFQSASVNLNDPTLLQQALRQPTLAALYAALQRLQSQMTIISQVVRPTERLHSSTVYQTKRISFYDGRRTRTRYLTDSGSVVTATETLFTTETLPMINSALLPQQQQLRNAFASHLRVFASSLISISASATVTSEILSNQIQPTSTMQMEATSETKNLQGSMSLIPESSIKELHSQQSSVDLSSLLLPSDLLPQPSIAPNPMRLMDSINPLGYPSATPIIKTVLSTFTTMSSVTQTQTRIYTLIYNGFSTKYRTVSSTTVLPSKITTVSTQLITSTPTLDLHALLG